MKFFLLFIALLFILPILVHAQIIKISISQILGIEIPNLDYDKIVQNGELFNISFDIYNSGSVGYAARVRLDILKNNDSIFVGWSEELPLWPNSYGHYELFWYPSNSTEKFTARIRIYYANEIKELKPINFEVRTYSSPSSSIKITQFKTYEDKIKIGLVSDKDLKNIIIIPSDYPLGWIFEQVKLDSLSANKEKIIDIQYVPSIWQPIQVNINVVAENGKYFSSESFTMERETGIWSYISYVMESIRVMLKIQS